MVRLYVDEALINLISTYYQQPEFPRFFDVDGDGAITFDDITWWSMRVGTWVEINAGPSIIPIVAALVVGVFVGGGICYILGKTRTT